VLCSPVRLWLWPIPREFYHGPRTDQPAPRYAKREPTRSAARPYSGGWGKPYRRWRLVCPPARRGGVQVSGRSWKFGALGVAGHSFGRSGNGDLVRRVRRPLVADAARERGSHTAGSGTMAGSADLRRWRAGEVRRFGEGRSRSHRSMTVMDLHGSQTLPPPDDRRIPWPSIATPSDRGRQRRRS